MIITSFTKIPGLFYISNIKFDFSNLLEKIDEKPWLNISNSTKSRKVQHYGYKYDYRTSNIFEKTVDIPNFLSSLKRKITKICKMKRLITDNKSFNEYFNQCIINNYEGNQGIGKHIDTPKFGDVICCVTINSGAIMRFRLNGEKKEIYVEPNSIYIMSGDARYKWTHEMPPNFNDIINGKKIKRGRRISITFRNVPIKKK